MIMLNLGLGGALLLAFAQAEPEQEGEQGDDSHAANNAPYDGTYGNLGFSVS